MDTGVFFTVTVQLNFFPPRVAVIVALPAFFARTLPFRYTQAVFAYIKGEKAYVTYSNLNPSRHTANTGYVFKYATNDKTANDFFQKQSNAVLKRTMGAFDVFLANVQMTAKDLGFTSYS